MEERIQTMAVERHSTTEARRLFCGLVRRLRAGEIDLVRVTHHGKAVVRITLEKEEY